MRLTLFYITRTVKNQILKLCHTWVAVFLLVCILFGVIVGLGAAFLTTALEGEDGVTEDSVAEEMIPEGEAEGPSLTDEEIYTLTELIAGGILLFVIAFAVFLADKSGSSIFLMADVNLLFPAPMKPQSVLLFRLVIQAGTSLFFTVYLLFQMPNLMLNLGMSAGAVLAILAAWFLMLLYSKLISVLFYTLSATHPAFKARMRPGLYAVLLALAAAFFLFSKEFDGNYLAAADAFFNAPLTRFIPIFGWIKAVVLYGVMDNMPLMLLFLGVSLLGAVLMIFIIWNIKADFYEDAMARSAETAELQQAMQQTGSTAIRQRKKDRSEKLKRDGLSRGFGANVYFFKSIYNRFRFAHFGFLTKTAETYLVLGVGVSCLMRFAVGTNLFAPVALTLAGLTFFRALGNAIEEDVRMESFFLVPDSAWKKIFYSFLGGITNSALDLLPSVILSAIVLAANPAEAILWFLLILSIGAYADSVGIFIDLSLSTGLSNNIRTLVQICFIYFGLIPSAGLMIVGFAFNAVMLFAGIATLFHIAVSAIFLAIVPLFVINGRR